MSTPETAAKRIQTAFRVQKMKRERHAIARSAYSRYTGGGFKSFHNILSGKPKSNNATNRTLLAFLRHHPIMKTPRVYKNTNMLYRGLSAQNSNTFLRNGQISSASFQSFSKSRMIAKGYSRGVIIVLPRGKFPHIVSGKYQYVTKFPFEQEVTLPPGTLINTGAKTKNGNYIVRIKNS